MKHLFLILTVAVMMTAYAADKPPSDSETEADTCETDAQSYDHGAMKFFHSMLCLGNRRFAGMAENIFYHMVVDMGLDVSTGSLPADGSTVALESKTFKSKTITGTAQLVVAPDSFATTYDYRATLSVDGTQFMDVRWSGKGKDSKGFLAMIPSAMKPGGGAFTGKGLLYIRWDRTDATAQSIEVLGSRFASSFLTTATSDRATFYKGTLNDSTKAVTVQLTSIEESRSTPGSFACYTMYGDGTLGGSIRVGKTASNGGHAVGFGTQTTAGPDWDDCEATDTKTFANGSGNGTTVEAFAMNYSCSDVNGLDGSGKPFEGDTVSFSLTKSQVDAMFGVN